MKWRVLLAVAAGLLLTLPFTLTLAVARYPKLIFESTEGVEVLPVLSAEERRELLTLERVCQRPEDCEPTLGCVELNPGQPNICAASECTTDLDCDEGFTCRTLRTLGKGPRVRWCILEGWRKEGEPCMQGLGLRRNNCARGLLCAGWCGRPCELDDPESCPEGFYCQRGADGPTCLPTCEGLTCPEGLQCISFHGRTSVCGEVRGQDCQRTPCAEGSVCRLHLPRKGPRGPLVGMECVQPCGEGKPPCPDGQVCASRECRRPCEPDTPGACGPDEVCKPHPVEKRGLCHLQTKP